MNPQLKITLHVDDKGSVQIRQFGSLAQSAVEKTELKFRDLNKTVMASYDHLCAMTAAVVGLGAALGGLYAAKEAAAGFMEVANSFEAMRVKLDTLTKGKGTETLEAINAWALRMPVNTRQAVDTFVMMQAMGLEPTIEKMTTLVDVASVFGDEAMPRVARALGQMQQLGKLSAEELNQLAEAGINARKYLSEAFGGQTVEQIQKSGVEIERVIAAIMDGMKREFGGAAAKAMDTWRGMTTTLVSYWDEFRRRVMDAGVFEGLKLGFREVLSEIERLRTQGRLDEWAGDLAKAMVGAMQTAILAVGQLGEVMRGLGVAWLTAEKAFLSAQEYAARFKLMMNEGTAGEGQARKRLIEVQQAIADVEAGIAAATEANQAWNEAVWKLNGLLEKAKGHTKGVTDHALPALTSGMKTASRQIELTKEDLAEIDKTIEALERKWAAFEKQFEAAALAAKTDEWRLAMIRLYGDADAALDEMQREQQERLDAEERYWSFVEKEAIATYEKEVEAAREAARRTEELWIRGLDRVQEAFADTFYDAMTGQLDGLEDAFRSFFRDILRMVAEVAAKMTMFDLFGVGAGHGGFGWSTLFTGGLSALLNGGSTQAGAIQAAAGIGGTLLKGGWGVIPGVGGFLSTPIMGGNIYNAMYEAGILDSIFGTMSWGDILLPGIGGIVTGLLSGSIGKGAGAGLGGIAGSILMPGIGTIVGSVLGGLLGGLFGEDRGDVEGSFGIVIQDVLDKEIKAWSSVTVPGDDTAINDKIRAALAQVFGAYIEQISTPLQQLISEGVITEEDIQEAVGRFQIGRSGLYVDTEHFEEYLTKALQEDLATFQERIGAVFGEAAKAMLEDLKTSEQWTFLTADMRAEVEELLSSGTIDPAKFQQFRESWKTLDALLGEFFAFIGRDYGEKLTDVQAVAKAAAQQFNAYITAMRQAGVDVAKLGDIEALRSEAIAEQIRLLKESQEAELLETKYRLGLITASERYAEQIATITERYKVFGLTVQQMIEWFSAATLSELWAVAEYLGISTSDLISDLSTLAEALKASSTSAGSAADSLTEFQHRAESLVSMQAEILGLTQEFTLAMIEFRYGMQQGSLSVSAIREILAWFTSLNTAEEYQEVVDALDALGIEFDQFIGDIGALNALIKRIEEGARSIEGILAEPEMDIARWQAAQAGQEIKRSDQLWAMYATRIRSLSASNIDDLKTMAEYLTDWYRAAVADAQAEAQAEAEQQRLLEQVTAKIGQLVDQIEDTIHAIKYSTLNLTVPSAKAAEATQDYAALLAAALSETATETDVKAFTSFAREYLTLQQAAYKSSARYQEAYQAVMADLAAVQAHVQTDDFKSRLKTSMEAAGTEAAADLAPIIAAFTPLAAELRGLVTALTTSTSAGSWSPSGLNPPESELTSGTSDKQMLQAMGTMVGYLGGIFENTWRIAKALGSEYIDFADLITMWKFERAETFYRPYLRGADLTPSVSQGDGGISQQFDDLIAAIGGAGAGGTSGGTILLIARWDTSDAITGAIAQWLDGQTSLIGTILLKAAWDTADPMTVAVSRWLSDTALLGGMVRLKAAWDTTDAMTVAVSRWLSGGTSVGGVVSLKAAWNTADSMTVAVSRWLSGATLLGGIVSLKAAWNTADSMTAAVSRWLSGGTSVGGVVSLKAAWNTADSMTAAVSRWLSGDASLGGTVQLKAAWDMTDPTTSATSQWLSDKIALYGKIWLLTEWDTTDPTTNATSQWLSDRLAVYGKIWLLAEWDTTDLLTNYVSSWLSNLLRVVQTIYIVAEFDLSDATTHAIAEWIGGRAKVTGVIHVEAQFAGDAISQVIGALATGGTITGGSITVGLTDSVFTQQLAQLQSIATSTAATASGISSLIRLVTPSAPSPAYQRYAEGGISWMPELAYVGESGPEAHIPLRSGAVPVIISDRSGGSDRPIHVTIEVGGEEFTAVIARVADSVRVKAERQKLGAKRVYADTL